MTTSRAERRQDADPALQTGLGAQRRKELRQQRRRERLRNLWRILVLAGSATGLGWLLLREGWVLRSPAQIEVLGSRQVNREQVIREGQLQLPLQLLSLRPQQLTARLSAGFPFAFEVAAKRAATSVMAAPGTETIASRETIDSTSP